MGNESIYNLILDLVSRELGFNRFCGTIAAKNPNRKLNTQEECELSDVLASNSLSLFREDALLLMKKITANLSLPEFDSYIDM